MRTHRNPRMSGKPQWAYACESCEKEHRLLSSRRRREKNSRTSAHFLSFFAPNLSAAGRYGHRGISRVAAVAGTGLVQQEVRSLAACWESLRGATSQQDVSA